MLGFKFVPLGQPDAGFTMHLSMDGGEPAWVRFKIKGLSQRHSEDMREALSDAWHLSVTWNLSVARHLRYFTEKGFGVSGWTLTAF